MMIIDSQVHAYCANTPQRPWRTQPKGWPEHVTGDEMVAAMDKEGFGKCSNVTACEAECPKEISVENIARMNREYLSATFVGETV